MNYEITSADIETYKSTILEQQRVLQEMLVDPKVGIGHIYELIAQTVAQLDGATEDWLGEDICLSGSGYAPETDDEGNITRIVKISKAVCTASFNGAYGIILDTKSNSILYTLEEAETKARDDLVLQFGYHAELEPQPTTTQAGNHFYYEQRVRRWYAFFPVEESSITF